MALLLAQAPFGRPIGVIDSLQSVIIITILLFIIGIIISDYLRLG